MRINVKLFAILRDRAGTAELVLDMPAATTVLDAAEALFRLHPSLRDFASKAAYAVNRAYTRQTTVLEEGDELAIIPPVSGG